MYPFIHKYQSTVSTKVCLAMIHSWIDVHITTEDVIYYFPCRMCHDDTKTHYSLDQKLVHSSDRRSIVTMRCRYCRQVQDIGDMCVGCSQIMGNYFCKICKFLDLDNKNQFHCDGCGICRIGGRDNFIHCDICGLCVVNNVG
jgi:RING finger/CHY zinc finger protein 1